MFMLNTIFKRPTDRESRTGSHTALRAPVILTACLLLAYRFSPWFQPQPTDDGGRIEPGPKVAVELALPRQEPRVYLFDAPPAPQALLEAAGFGDTRPVIVDGIPGRIPHGSRVELTVSEEGVSKLHMGTMETRYRILLGMPLDLNRCSYEELEALPYLSEARLRRVREYLRTHRPIRNLQQLKEDKILTSAQYDRIKPFVVCVP